MASPDMQRYLNVQRWVYEKLLVPLTIPQEVKMEYIDGTRLPYWVAGMTHETADTSPDNGRNYEKVELGGDKILSTLAWQFFAVKYPTMKVSQLTEMISYYSNGKIQEEVMFRKIDRKSLSGIFLTGMGVGIERYNLSSDIFESIFGTLFLVADSVSRGTGYAACGILYSFFYDDFPFDINYSYGIPKNQVRKILTRYYDTVSTPLEIIKVSVPGQPAEITIKVRQVHVDALIRHKAAPGPPGYSSYPLIPLQAGTVIGYGKGDNVDDASDIAYSQALNTLKSYGLTVQWSDTVKLADDLSDPRIVGYMDRLRTRLIEDGFVTIDVTPSAKMSTKTSKIYILYGIRPDTTRKFLASVEGSLDRIESFGAMLGMYINKDPVTFKVLPPGKLVEKRGKGKRGDY
jgi:hypothetical protein